MGKSFKENPSKYKNVYSPHKKKHGRSKPNDIQPDEDWQKLNDIRHGHGSNEAYGSK